MLLAATFAIIKQLLAILLLTGLFFGTTGFHLVFKYRQYLVKKEIKIAIKAGVPEHELVVIEVTDSNEHEVEWIEDHEFRFRGSMYDVIRIVTFGRSTKYYCIDDKKESALFENLELLTGIVNSENRNERECSVFLFALLTHIVVDTMSGVQNEIDHKLIFSSYYYCLRSEDFVSGFYSPPEIF